MQNDKYPTYQLIGVYPVQEEDDVYLIELLIKETPINIDISSFVQQNPALPKSEWQVPYDEHYLNYDGTKIIGDYFNVKTLLEKYCRVAFYMYIEDFKLPLSTPFGDISLLPIKEMPERLSTLLSFNGFD